MLLWTISTVATVLFAVDGLYWVYNYPEEGTFLRFLAEHCQIVGSMGLGLALLAVSASLPRKARVFDHTLLISLALALELEFLQSILYTIDRWWTVPLGFAITNWTQLLWLILAVRLPTWTLIRRWWFPLSVVFFLFGATRVLQQFGSYLGQDYVLNIAPLLIVSGLFFLMRRPRGTAS